MNSFSHSTPGFVSSVTSLHRTLCVAFFGIQASLFAAGGPPPTTVQGHVSVEGVVEVLNDVLYQPYNESRGLGSTQASGAVSFDVPAGKRLVVQSISIRATVTSGLKVRVEGQFAAANGSAFVDVALQSQGVFGEVEFLSVAQPLTFRVDGSAASGEIFFSYQRTGTSGITNLRVNVYGYLVDITQ